jgi:hypothetical protein
MTFHKYLVKCILANTLYANVEQIRLSNQIELQQSRVKNCQCIFGAWRFGAIRLLQLPVKPERDWRCRLKLQKSNCVKTQGVIITIWSTSKIVNVF